MSPIYRLALACLICLASCSSPEKSDALCQGVICSAGQCVSLAGAPACVCGEADRKAELSCSIATPISAGASRQDTIVSGPDRSTRNFYLFHPEAGHTYAFVVDQGMADNIQVRWVDANQNDLTPPQAGQRVLEVDVPPQSPGTYYFVVSSGFAGQQFTYWFLDTSGDSSSPNAPIPIEFDHPLSGTFESAADVDSYVFTAAADVYVRPSCIENKQAPCSLKLTTLSGTVRDVSDWRNENLDKVTRGSTVRIDVQHAEPGRPLPPSDYAVTLSQIATDDFGDTASDAAPLVVGEPINGVIELPEDKDCFSFPAKAGEVYEVLTGVYVSSPDHPNLSSNEPFKSTISQPLVVCAWGALGSYTLECVDLGADDVGDSQATARPLDGAGSFDANIEFKEDVDWYSFPVVAGHDYLVRAGGCGNDCQLHLVPPHGEPLLVGGTDIAFHATGDGTGFFSVQPTFFETGPYHVELRDVIDEAGDTPDTATTIAVPSLISGALGVPYDVDWYAFPVTAGHYYVARCTGFQPDDVAGSNCDLGRLLVDGQPGWSGVGVVDFHANTDGVGRIEISTASHTAASYQVTLTEGVDDIGNTPDASVPLDGGVGQGVLEYPYDTDVFSLDAGSLELFSVQCTPGFGVKAGDFGGLCPTLVEQVSPGPLYLSVFGPSVDGGAYQLSVEPSGFDDYGNDPATATPLSLATPTSGTLELPGDQDVFSFPVTAGTAYTLHVACSEELPLNIEGPGFGQATSALNSDHEFTAQETGTAYFSLSAVAGWTATPTSYVISIATP